jgi:hypothetical protein
LGNPLVKLYKEKRDDSEKVRFAVRAKDQFKKEDRPGFGQRREEHKKNPTTEE